MSTPKLFLPEQNRSGSGRILIPGEQLTHEGAYIFVCPTCRKEFRYDDPYGPICTGPSETRDEHAPVAMKLVRRDQAKVTV